MTDETLPPSEDAVNAKAQPLTLAHTIDGGTLARITFKNALLNIPTLGIWSFWAKTRIRRYLWSNIQIAGDPLYYSGTGFELFKGAIIALLVLAALFVPVGILSTMGYQVFTGPLQFLIFIFLTPLGMFFARRYRLSRTEWRGIRAGFSGNWKVFMPRALGLTLLSLLTLGFAEPFRQVYIERYFWNNSYFGTERFKSSLNVSSLRYLYWGIWALFLLIILLFIRNWVGISRHPEMFNSPFGEDFLKERFKSSILILFAAATTFLIASALLRLQVFRASASALSLGGLNLRSTLSSWRVIKLFLRAVFILMIPGMIAVGFGYYVLSVIVKYVEQITPWLAFGVYGVGTLGILAAVSAVWAQLWTARLAAEIIGTLSIAGDIDDVSIHQSTLPPPGRGEGLLGAVDFAG
ncbi:MAG: DUF898 family protein [Elstera sp.]